MLKEPCRAHSRHTKSVSSAPHPVQLLYSFWPCFLHSKPAVLSWDFQELCLAGHLQRSGWLARWREKQTWVMEVRKRAYWPIPFFLLFPWKKSILHDTLCRKPTIEKKKKKTLLSLTTKSTMPDPALIRGLPSLCKTEK